MLYFNRQTRLLKTFLSLALIMLVQNKAFAAFTFDWDGSSSTAWTTTANWTVSGSSATGTAATYPGSSPLRTDDVVRFGVAILSLYTNQPVLTLTAGQSITVGSVTFGSNQFIVGNPLFTGTNLTVNVGTLNVAGNITQNINTNAVGNSTINNFLMGTGIINCAGIQVGSPTGTTSNYNFLFSEVKNLNISGNVAIYMNTMQQNGCAFRLQAGSMALTGQIAFTVISGVNSSNAGYFTIDAINSSGVKSSPTLTLSNANALGTTNPLPQNGTFNKATINFNGTSLSGGKITVIYTAANPTIYTSSLKGFGPGGPTINSGPNYDNLIINGTGTAVIGLGSTAGILKTDSAFTTSINTTFASAPTTTTIGTNWQNDATATITGGAGTTTVNGNINNDGTMNMATGNLTIGSNYTNTGTFTQAPLASDPTVASPVATNTTYFTGASPVLKNLTSSDITNFNNLVFTSATAGTPSIIGSGDFGIASTGVLQLKTTNSTLQVSGLLTLKSDASSTATVAAIGTGSKITGVVNVQRYITGGSGYRGYRLMSSPVNVSLNTGGGGSTGLTYIGKSPQPSFAGTALNAAFTGGPGTGFTLNGIANPSMYLYDESLTTNNTSFVAGKNVGIYSITSDSTVTITSGKPAVQTTGVKIPVGNSFLFFFIGDNSKSTTSAASRPSPENTTVTSYGYLNQGSVTVKFWNKTNTGTTTIPYHTGTGGILPGYNQLGNPYASTIDLTLFYPHNNVAISNIFWEMTEPGQKYISYQIGGATSDPKASKYIVSGQGFIIQGINGTTKTVTFNEADKTTYPTGFVSTNTSTPALLMSTKGDISLLNRSLASSVAEENPLAGMHIQIKKDNIANAACGIYFSKTNNDNFRDAEDAIDLDGGNIYMSSYSLDGVRTGINQLADYKEKGKRIKLFVKAGTSGLYNLNLLDIKNVDTVNYKVYLVDKLKKDSLDIGKYKSYAFNLVTTDTATFGANRFELSINQVPASKYQLATFTAQKAADGVLLTWRTLNEGNNYFFTLEKQQVNGTDYSQLYNIQSNGGTIYKYTDKTPNTGNNVYRLKQVDLFGNIAYSNPINVYYDKTGMEGMFSVYPNPTTETLNINVTYAKTNPATSSYKLNIYDATGSLVMQKTSANAAWNENVSQFKPGIYIVELKAGDGNLLGKVKLLKQ
jgi:hypothetical protein